MNDNKSVTDNYRLEWCTCRVCGAANRSKVYTVKEMMYRTEEEFDYFVCTNCNCMQIGKIPEDLGQYYADDYYSFQECEIPKMEGSGNTDRRILDVGCGAGSWLLERAEEGYGNLFGCDPFIKKDIRYGERVFIKKGEVSEMEGEFDEIRFKDSFEHIANPLEALENGKQKLSKDGKCEIRIPVFPNAAWDTFGTNWYQLDAPRHLFLHSEASMVYLCYKCGLRIKRIIYSSDLRQFVISYLYEQGYGLKEIENGAGAEFYMNKETWEYFSQLADECNQKGYGDLAVFEIVHA